MSRFLLAIDQGTSSSRTVIYDHSIKVVASAQQEFPQIYPQPGWVEHDPLEIWESQLRAARGVLAKAGASAADVAALGITNQRETAVVWDRATGRPIHRAIVWQSRQTAPICADLRSRGLEHEVRERTGLLIDAYFSATKIRFILDAVDGAQKRAEAGELCFGTVDCWLLYRLTGGRVHATEYSNASRTLVYNIHERDWDPVLLEALNIPRAMLPEVRDSSGVLGEADPEWLGAAVPVAGMAGDQQAALFGQGCVAPGQAKNTYGTGCFMLLHTGGDIVHSENGMLTTVAYQIGDDPAQYALEGSVAIAGAGVQWLRDNLGLIESAAEVESLAATVDDNGGVYFVPAFSGLFAPWWRDDARGIIAGLTRFANSGHLAKAVLEATAYQTRDVFEAMASDAGSPVAELKVDGGMVVNDTLMQFQADILDVPVVRPQVNEATVLGAAYAAGLATGFWESTDELRSHWAVDRIFEPAMPEAKREVYYRDWLKAVSKSTGWAS